MLANARVQPTLPAVDLERARKFYEGTLGLKVIREDPSPGAVLQAGEGSTIYLYQRASTKAEHTVAAFTVKNVESTVRELKAKGVVFEDVDVPGVKSVEGVATMAFPSGVVKAAWFRDTEGNTLGVTDM